MYKITVCVVKANLVFEESFCGLVDTEFVSFWCKFGQSDDAISVAIEKSEWAYNVPFNT